MADNQDKPLTDPFTNVTTFPLSRGVSGVNDSIAHELGHGVNSALLDFSFAPDKEIFAHQWMNSGINKWPDWQRTTWDPADSDSYSVTEEYNALHFENQIDWMINYAQTTGIEFPSKYQAKGLKHYYGDFGATDDSSDDYSTLKFDAQEYFRTHNYLDPSIPHSQTGPGEPGTSQFSESESVSSTSGTSQTDGSGSVSSTPGTSQTDGSGSVSFPSGTSQTGGSGSVSSPSGTSPTGGSGSVSFPSGVAGIPVPGAAGIPGGAGGLTGGCENDSINTGIPPCSNNPDR